MTRDDLRDARRTLGEAWGLDRPLTLMEMAQVLRLSGRDPGQSLWDYERGKTTISGPLSLAVELLLAGGRPPEVDELLEQAGFPPVTEAGPVEEIEAVLRGALQAQIPQIYFWDPADRELFNPGPREWTQYADGEKLADRFDLGAVARTIVDALAADDD